MQDAPIQSTDSPAATDQAGIEIQVRQVDELFEPFDPSPMQRRRVAAAAERYITDRAAESPPTRVLHLTIRLPAGQSSCCEAVQHAFRSHFASAASSKRAELRRHFSVSWRTFFFAVIAAVALVYLSQSIAGASEIAVMNKIANGLSIAVWVVLWRPFEMLIHDWRPLGRQHRLYQRLERIQVTCVAG